MKRQHIYGVLAALAIGLTAIFAAMPHSHSAIGEHVGTVTIEVTLPASMVAYMQQAHGDNTDAIIVDSLRKTLPNRFLTD